MTGFDDFLTDPLGELPDWLELLVMSGSLGVGGSTTVEELEDSASGRALRIVNDSSFVRGFFWMPDVAPFASGDMTLLFRAPGFSGTERPLLAPCARIGPADPPDEPHDSVSGGFAGRINFARLYHAAAATSSPFHQFLDEGEVGFTPSVGDRLWARFNFRPELYHVKVWRAVNPEPTDPGSWQIDSNVSPDPTEVAGFAGIAFDLLDAANTTWIEALGWSTDPAEPAPLARSIDFNPRGRRAEGRRRSLVGV